MTNPATKTPSLQGRKRVVLYARVSKSEGQHTENQVAQLRDYIRQQPDWSLTKQYVDHASGASAENRPQFQLMMYAASQAEFDLLIFWSLDRLTREGAHRTLEYLGKLDHYKIGYRSLTEPFLDTTGPFKDVLISIMGALGQQERNRLRERIKAGMNRARSKGVVLGRKRQVWDAARLAKLSEKHSLSEIAKMTGISRATASRRIKDYKERSVDGEA
jgi:DNA invertase Pin-like site-specific DNA recombinase